MTYEIVPLALIWHDFLGNIIKVIVRWVVRVLLLSIIPYPIHSGCVSHAVIGGILPGGCCVRKHISATVMPKMQILYMNAKA